MAPDSRRHSLDIAAKRVLSPKDFQVRMHLYKGAVYGVSPAADLRVQFPHASQIPGLYQAGQTTYPGFCVAPAAMSSIFAAETLMKMEDI
jgi:phytoene desaturase